MLRLMLLRHAKAAPQDPARDHARALAPRGLADAAALARDLAGEHMIPDAVLVSDARRTRETLAAMQAAWPDLAATQASADPALYHAGAEALLRAVRKAGAAKTLLLVGHNPGLAELALSLAGHGDRYALARMSEKFPTCALAVLDFDCAGWAGVAARGGRLDRFAAPSHGEAD